MQHDKTFEQGIGLSLCGDNQTDHGHEGYSLVVVAVINRHPERKR
jgi:hypothetical protein